MDISERTLKRWRSSDGRVTEDRRPDAERVEQPHKLTQAEELAILSACNQPQYRSSPPSQIVPSLADKGVYLARKGRKADIQIRGLRNHRSRWTSMSGGGRRLE